jgi:hypothetical protein
VVFSTSAPWILKRTAPIRCGEDDPNTSATVCIARRLGRRMLLRFGDGAHHFYYSNGEFRSAD